VALVVFSNSSDVNGSEWCLHRVENIQDIARSKALGETLADRTAQISTSRGEDREAQTSNPLNTIRSKNQ
jgi:hypothetical protein